MERKVEIISEQLIKPSLISQTCSHFEAFNFSAIDQLAPPAHVPILLYYPHDPADHKQAIDSSTKSIHLKSSLSKILADFYPFAGRINGNSSIAYNNNDDDGVLFVEAFANNYSLQDIITHHETKNLGQFLPKYSILTSIVLLVQVTFFECGGMILGCWASHKLADATSICTFINCWAATARGAPKSPSPDFTTGIQIFPPTKHYLSPLPFSSIVQEDQCVSKIFVFDASSVANLKSKASSKDVPIPTRVEAVSALIWKCATASSKRSSSSNLSHAVNCRKRLVPPLSRDTIGNFTGFYLVSKRESDEDLSKLVPILRKGSLEFPNNCDKPLTWDVAYDPIIENNKIFGDTLSNRDIELYHFTSWVGMSFYDADFGWGKPSWFSIMELHYKNTIVLMDANNGGIEAWICLEAKHMEEFEQNSDLLTFASTKHVS